MLILIRIFLVSLIIYLIIRSFTQYNREEEDKSQDPPAGNNNRNSRRISRETGEYIDFEEERE
jgi:large-conductance mechanosensitive channel